MSNTFRKSSRKFDDDMQHGRTGRHHHHSNNRRHGGIRIINEYDDWSEDDFDQIHAELEDELDELASK